MTLSALHEALVRLFRSDPSLAEALWPLPAGPPGPLREVDPTLTQLVPQALVADLAFLAGDPPKLAVLVEAQLWIDDRKRLTWPAYATAMRLRWECPVAVLVVTPKRKVASWAAKPIPLGPGSGVFRVTVLGPGSLPLVTPETVAGEPPGLAVLSALAHGNGVHGIAALEALIPALDRLCTEDAAIYYHVVKEQLNGARRKAMEAMVPHQEKFDLTKTEYFKDNRPLREAYYAALAMGHDKGLAEGHAEGHAEGRSVEARRIVIRQLGLRCGIPDAATQARISALDVDALEALADALLGFETPDELARWLDAR